MRARVSVLRKSRLVLLLVPASMLLALPAEGRGGRVGPQRPAAQALTAEQAGYLSEEERRVVTAMANRLRREIVEVVADPGVAQPAGSVRERIHKAFLRLAPTVRASMVQNARRIRALPEDQRARYYVPRTLVGERLLRTPNAPSGVSTLHRDIVVAVHRRLDRAFLRQGKTQGPGMSAGGGQEGGVSTQGTKTTLEIGWFRGELRSDGKREITIEGPTKIDARWATTESQSEEAGWELRRVVPALPDVLVAQGNAGPAPGGVFTIDLAPYLPATAPESGMTLLLRVRPRTKARILKTPGAQPGSYVVTKVPAKNVGWPSLPARIHYRQPTSPPTQFDDNRVYRTAEYVLESIRMVDDQSGPGGEEFHLVGFVREQRGVTGEGSQKKLSRWHVDIGESDRSRHSIDRRRSFQLNNPDQPQWPRVYVALISILEEDSGGSLEVWEEGIWDVADEMLSSQFANDIKNAVETWLQEHADEVAGWGVDAATHLASLIAGLFEMSAATVVGLVVAATILVAVALIAGAEDDYYGTHVETWMLPSNRVTRVRNPNGYPDDVLESLSAAERGGSPLAGGGWRTNTIETIYKGQAVYPSASGWDGVVAIYHHMEYKDPEEP